VNVASAAPDLHARILAVVRHIPRGRVATYGQVARLAGVPRHARLVGYALHAAGDSGVPWQRVINARGEISPRAWSGSGEIQRERLEAEGIAFDAYGRIDLARFGWSE
jgi:methylated-DNA-protein-cysteine methyltransferase-like protein